MKKLLYFVFALWTAAGVFGAEEPLDVAGLQAEVRSWAGDQPGAIVALVIDGEARGVVSAGRWSAEDARAADEHTAFELGSISKLFTALLTADAVADGVLRWDEPVAGCFADSTVTYAMLATHTSGLPSLPAKFPATDLVDPYKGLTVDDLRASYAMEVAKLDPAALPAAWGYSNLAVSVLGQAVAAELGQAYGNAVKARVIEPLGLGETWLSTSSSPAPANLAPGHNADGAASRWHLDGYAPAGAWVSTAADMERFMRGLMDWPARWASTMEVHGEAPGSDAMGYGWFVREEDGGTVFWHGGGTGGYRAFVGIQPKTRRGIVVLAGRDQDVTGLGAGWLAGMYNAAASGDGADLPAIVPNEFVGDYPLSPNFVITVFSTAEGLRAQATGQPSFALRRVERDQFGLEGVPARVTFQRDEIGAVVGLTLNQAGRTMPASRHDLDSQQKPVAGIALSDEQLAGIEGVYELAPAFLITIGRDRQLLTARATGQGAAPIFASAADEFFYQVVDAQISFKRDEAGVVTGLVLHQNGQNIPGRKR